MESDYLTYNFVNIEDKQNSTNFFVKDKTSCMKICDTDINCQGVNIVNPICYSVNDNISKTNVNQCIKSHINNGIENLKTENLTKYNCNLLTNINQTNYIADCSNNNSFVKKKYVNNLNNLLPNYKYYLKINNKYIGIQNQKNLFFLVNVDEKNVASIFQFNNKGNLIETKTNKCVQINGNYLVLGDCIQENESQIFIYENKTNTIRPSSNILNNNLCFSTNNNESNNIVLEKCNYTNNKNQNILYESDKENFMSERYDLKNLNNINFCSNVIYKTTITLILCCILIYFIWYLTRKQYNYNNDFDNKTFIFN